MRRRPAPLARRTVVLIGLVVVLAGAMVAWLAIATNPQIGSFEERVEALEHTSGDFYAVPDPLPAGEPGELLRLQTLPGSESVRMYRAMYHSTSVDGRPVAVTGTIWIPTGEPPVEGFPILAWGPGFDGLGDDCALSRHPYKVYWGVLNAFVRDGFVVVSTDYEGHGTRYPFLDTIGASATRSLLDGARAAQDLLGQAVSDRVVVAGHSLGGDAASTALIHAPSYADGLDIRGVVSIEPVGDVDRLAAGEPAQDEVGVFLLMRAIRGAIAAWPDIRAEEVLTPYGIELLNTLDEEGCREFPKLDTIPEAEALKVDPMSVEPWAEHFRSWTVMSAPYPVFYIMAANGNGLADNVRRGADRLCGTADHVIFREYPDSDHDSVVDVAYADYAPWLLERVKANPPVDGCHDGRLPTDSKDPRTLP